MAPIQSRRFNALASRYLPINLCRYVNASAYTVQPPAVGTCSATLIGLHSGAFTKIQTNAPTTPHRPDAPLQPLIINRVFFISVRSSTYLHHRCSTFILAFILIIIIMPPHEGLVHLKEYDIKDSNVELIGTDIDHQVKYKSAAEEPAWQAVGKGPGLLIWRIENFQVVPWPEQKYGQFFDGDSFIVLYSFKVGKDGSEKLGHEIYFWLGSHASQDEAGTAAYKTVELDEFLHGAASQHREVQTAPSDEFLALFPKISIRSGGVRSGFRHVEETPQEEVNTLLRVFTNPGSKTSNGVVVHEVEPTYRSLDDSDVFIFDKGDKIWVWQGKSCSPMEKAKAAQVVHDMTLAKHVEVEVVAQTESRSRRVITLLGGDTSTQSDGFKKGRPIASGNKASVASGRSKKLFKLSDGSGQLSFSLVKDGNVTANDLDGNDVFLLDSGKSIWVWEGQGASRAEKAQWLRVAQAYIRQLSQSFTDSHLIPLAKVSQGNETKAFQQAIAA